MPKDKSETNLATALTRPHVSAPNFKGGQLTLLLFSVLPGSEADELNQGPAQMVLWTRQVLSPAHQVRTRGGTLPQLFSQAAEWIKIMECHTLHSLNSTNVFSQGFQKGHIFKRTPFLQAVSLALSLAPVL